MNPWVWRMAGVGLFVVFGCNRTKPHESTANVAQPATTGPCSFGAPPTGGSVSNVTFTVKTPSGVPASDVALGTDLGALRLAGGVHLVKDAGGFAAFSSVEASARLVVEPDVIAQSAYSEPTGIDLGARTHLYGLLKTAGTLAQGPNVVIDGGISQNTSLAPLTAVSWNVAFPSLNRGSCDLQPDQSQTIDPGSYGNIAIKPRSHLKLRAGTYYFTSLTLEASAVLDVDNAAGPIFVNVKNGFAWSGGVVETQPAKPNVVFALATSAPTNLSAPLRGIVVAPAAALTLSSSGSTGYVGSFFAKSLEAQGNVVVHQRGFSPASVCPGASDCSALCPCGGGGSCQSDAECQAGFTCQASPAGGAKVCTPLVVDDGNPCTADSFNGTTVVHTPLPAGTSCADGNACNGAETCDGAGTCVVGTPIACVALDRCHDAGVCDPLTGACSNPQKADGSSCADATLCNGDERCQAGVCANGAPPAVDDANPCTSDACDAVAGVTHTPVASGTSCSNGNACDGAETCDGAGTCVAGTPVTCSAVDVCHDAGVCDPATGACSNPAKPDGASCADGSVCNGSEMCLAGACASGTPLVVDDGNPCTADACNPTSGVSHTPLALGVSCDDGDVCNGVRTCNGTGVCRTATPPVINDNNPCTSDSCDPITGVHHVANTGASCDDNNVCNGVKLCDAAGVCQPGTPPVINDNNPCTTDSCDPITGPFHTALTGTSCDDGNKCNGISTCASGVCQPGTPPVLDDGNPCTTDTCTASIGPVHTPKTVGTSCDDGNLCNGVSTCASGGVCQSGQPPALDDQNPCTADTCDPATGVKHTLLDAGASCDDGDECNGVASCDGTGVCVPGPLDALVSPEPLPPAVGPLSRGVPGSILSSALSLVEGDSPVQTCLTPGLIEPRRVVLASGRVLFEGEPLAGARIRVVGHPEFGYAASGEDGRYQLVINGGPTFTLRVSYPGLFPVDRQVDSKPYDSVPVADVVMLAPVATSASIAATSSVAQLAPGSVESDARGTRRASIYFPAGNDANAVFEDGRQSPLSTMTVRATEYTVGEDGPSRMPAPLPPASGYTYAVELSVDEAQALGAAHVQFSAPVSLYVDNFLGFPVGEVVPVGFYDRTLTAWVAEDNGRIMRVTAVTNGLAAIDATGDGVPESDSALLALGITADERQVIVADRGAGATFWRIPLEHFSPCDGNFPIEQPKCEGDVCPEAPGGDPETAPEQPRCPEGGPTLGGGSIIDIERQSLGEAVPVVGTPFTLNYQSANMPGDARERTVTVPFTRDNHSRFKSRSMQVDALGKSTLIPVANADAAVSFIWDGTDFAGRFAPGVHELKIITKEIYSSSYTRGSIFGGPPPTGAALANFPPAEASLQKEQIARVSSWDARELGLGGWSLDAHHTFHLDGGVLLRGDGSRLETGDGARRNAVDRAYEIMVPFAGTGVFSADPIPEGQDASTTAMASVAGLTMSPNGELYFVDGICHCQVWKIDRAGKLVLVGGTGVQAPTTPANDDAGDGGPARTARFGDVTDLALGMDGSVYVVERTRNRVRRIRPNGIVERFLGTGSQGTPTEGSVARVTAMTSPFKIAAGKDGNVFVTGNSWFVYRVDPNGKLNRVFGSDTHNDHQPSEGASALDAGFSPGHLALAPNGALYVADGSHVVRVGRDNRMHVMSAALPGPVLVRDGAKVQDVALSVADMGADPTTGELIVLSNYNQQNGQDTTKTFLSRVHADDKISVITGGPQVPGVSGQWDPAFQSQEIPVGLAALSSSFSANDAMALGPDGSIYLAPPAHQRIYRVGRRPNASGSGPSCAVVVPEQDGRTTYCFTFAGRHEETRDTASGQVRYSFSYGDDEQLSAITDFYGNTTRIVRNDPSSIDVIGPDGDETHLTLDGEELLTSVTDPSGGTHAMTYAAGGLLESFTDARGHTAHFAYGPDGALLTDSNAAAHAQSLEGTAIDDGRRVVHETPLGVATVIDRVATPAGEQRHETLAPDGTMTSIVVNKGGSRVTTLPDGTRVAETFAAQPGLGILVSYPGATTTTLPSGLTRLTNRSVEEGGGIRTLTTWTEGFTSVSTDRVVSGGFVERKLVTPEGRQRVVVLDAAGAVRREEPPGQLPVEYAYDMRGRLSSIVQGERQTTLTYVEEDVPDKGLVRTLTNALGEVTQFTWDEPGRQLTLADAGGGTTVLQSDTAGNLVDLTAPNGRIHHHDYGLTDLLDTYGAPNLGAPSSTMYTYDADERVTTVTYPDGSVVGLDYDAAGRLANTALPNGELHYTYYGATPCAGCAPGEIASLSGPGGAVLGFEYDGMLLKAATFGGAVTGRVEWQYDTQFQVATEAVVLSGVTSTLALDNDRDGRVVRVGPSTAAAADRLKLTRDPASARPLGWTLGGANVLVSYNPFGETTGFDLRFGTTSVRSEVIVTRDQLGRVSHRDEVRAGAGTSYDYAYDHTGNLSAVREDGLLRRTYGYDLDGNRLTVSEDGEVRHYVYDGQDRLTSDGKATYEYSASGMLASRTDTMTSAVTRFTYDALGKLLAVELPDGNEIQYEVDGRGRRLSRSMNGGRTQAFLYGAGQRVVAELDGSGLLRSRFAYANIDGVPDLMLRDGRRYLFGKDSLGSVREVIDADSGAVVQALRYDEFGVVVSDTNPGFQPFGFAGGLYDSATGLVHFGARDYDPSIGRWLSKDPLRFRANSANFYSYVHNDPVNYADPSGLHIYFSSDAALEKFLPLLDQMYQHSGLARIRLDQMFYSDDDFTFHDTYDDGLPTPHVSADGKDLYFDPDTFQGTYKSICGNERVQPERVLAHEMGHLEGDRVFGTRNEMRNIVRNENPIMQELGNMCDRTRYALVPPPLL